jgi:HEAT repeat protein
MESPNVPYKPEEAGDLENQNSEVLINSLLDSADPDIRQYAALLLGRAKDPRAIEPLIHALADLDKTVREQAMLALSTLGKTAIEPLSGAMNAPKWETRYRAAEALGKIADEKVIKPLIRGLKDERDHVRYMAAKGLREFGDSDAIEPMIILLDDQNNYVRIMVARALGAIGGRRVHDALTRALEAEQDEMVKEAILEAMK